MSDFVKKIVSHETRDWGTIFLVAIIFLIPFSVRHVFPTVFNFKTGAYSDFTSISLYLSDIVLFGFLVTSRLRNKTNIFTTWYLVLIFWLILELLFSGSSNLALQAYFSIRLAAIIGFAIVLGSKRLNSTLIALTFTILAAIQSAIAVFQFYFQKSLGLYRLGESHLDPSAAGIAKIVTHGTKLVRGYGTFPHSNLLAAFLVIAIIFNLYLLTKNYQKIPYLMLAGSLVLNIFGLFITFSRAGIGAGGVAVVGFLIILLISKNYKKFVPLFLISGLGLVLAIGLLGPYLSSRATISDSAVRERVFYNKIGLKIIMDKPLLGTGPGLSVLHMEQYSGEQLQPWEIQPIHNYYLITLAEWGIGGIILLGGILVAIVWLIVLVIRNWLENTQPNLWATSLAIAGLAILFLFLFDHYFYTIWPTQLLLWLIIGLIMSQIREFKNSQL